MWPVNDYSVHLVDGTFELFRCFHGAPRAQDETGREVGAVRGLLATLVSLLHQPDVSHVAVAFDSVVSPPPTRGPRQTDEQLIAAQAGLAARAVRALGVPVWPTGRYQADELIATAAAKFVAEAQVRQVVICSNDKDFHQCVRGDRVVALDRVRKVLTDEPAVREKYGVGPHQIPDLFALVGDRSDGLPGVPGWGAASAAALLTEHGTLAAIPLDESQWSVPVRGAARLAAALREHWDEALLCRDLSELRTDLPLRQTATQTEWRGAHREALATLCTEIGDDSVLARIVRWSDQ